MTTQTVLILLLVAAVILGVHFLEKRLDRKSKQSADKPSGESRTAERTGRTAVEQTQPR